MSSIQYSVNEMVHRVCAASSCVLQFLRHTSRGQRRGAAAAVVVRSGTQHVCALEDAANGVNAQEGRQVCKYDAFFSLFTVKTLLFNTQESAQSAPLKWDL